MSSAKWQCNYRGPRPLNRGPSRLVGDSRCSRPWETLGRVPISNAVDSLNGFGGLGSRAQNWWIVYFGKYPLATGAKLSYGPLINGTSSAFSSCECVFVFVRPMQMLMDGFLTFRLKFYTISAIQSNPIRSNRMRCGATKIIIPESAIMR